MTVAIGEQVLAWMLRRLKQAVPLDHDLVMVHDSPTLAGLGASLDIRGDRWRIARVTGELTLRDVLPEADRLIAIVPEAFPVLPMDLAGRTYLRRILDVRAEDVVAAVAGRACEGLVDEALARAVFDSFETLRGTAGKWSLGDLVRAREVRATLVSAELGAARLDRERDWELLARWLREGVPSFRAPTLVRDALVEAQPRTGAWLAWALTDGSLEQLCTAGALLASDAGRMVAPAIPGVQDGDREALIELVDSALREVWRSSPARAGEVLVAAEREARTVTLDAAQHRLLRMPLEDALSKAARDCVRGDPPDDARIEGLKRNLHAPELQASIAMVGDLARLVRFQRLELPADDDGGRAWFEFARLHLAWADLAFRRVRRSMESVPRWLSDPARDVLAAWLQRRDAINERFAMSLAVNWPTLAGNTDLRHPLALHQVARCLVKRLVDDGARVLLLVLDGCDLTSFLEIVEAIPASAHLGLTLPDVQDAALREDLRAIGAFATAIAPVPTVTSHARRALFAGEIAGNTVLDDTEATAANATADQRAWARNTALGQAPRRLFLKGELGSAGEPLLELLRRKDATVVAAVLNGVDDALSSRETTALPAWSLDALGAGAPTILRTAIDEGWRVLVTADHGHTPFVANERKIEGRSLGQRFGTEPLEGTVEFRSGPLPRQPLHLLARFGAWSGQQRRGYHGGAGLEEVAVPLAFLGRISSEQEGRPRAPAWWWSSDSAVPVVPVAPAPRAVAAVEPREVFVPAASLDARLASLSPDETRVVALLAQNGAVRLSAIVQHLKKPPNRVSGLMAQLVRRMAELGCPWIIVEQLPGDWLYRYEKTDRGGR